MFPSGSAERVLCINIPITSDRALEGDHEFVVEIVGAGSSPHAMVNDSSSNTAVIIEDDERKCVCVCATM